MNRSLRVRFSISLLLLISLAAPMATFAFDNGKKYFNDGMKHEAAEEWDKAVEDFALAVSDNPKNPEYRLHLTRALFNASQMFVKRGNTAANEKDYEAAYIAFKRAYAFDPTNELAKSEMERMVRLQQDLVDQTSPGRKVADTGAGLKIVPTGYQNAPGTVPQVPQKLEKLRDIPFPSGVDLQFIIKELAKDLDLNVLFDSESFRSQGRKTYIDLKNVTAAQALDYIFLQEGLFFQKVGPRTILIANQAQRTKFQQLVLRTFYLANASPKDIAKVVQTAIPAQPGRSQTIVLTDDATNSITIRDTEENIRLIGKLISSLDKDRAEVVMDVAIYEVNRSDLLQFGNQIGTQGELTTLGGSSRGIIGLGRTNIAGAATEAAAATVIPTAIATGIILPSMNLSAFQNKNDTKLIASTQIHAFNNEDSSATIGERVPVRSASFNPNVGNPTTGQNSIVSDVYNYEQIGLTLKFKPLVFPNQDVQVAMDIESKDISGAQTPTPNFTERTIKGTARIQNNKTLLLASVAQGQQSNGKQGLPLLGLIPIIGRLFTTPTRDNRQVDIVIAVTPRVIRAPAILPEDEIERSTGSLAVPTNSSLEAMLVEEDRQEMLAEAKRAAASAVPNNVSVQLPDRAVTAPQYVKAAADAPAGPATQTAATNAAAGDAASTKIVPPTIPAMLQPIDNSVKTLQLKQTSDTVDQAPDNGAASTPSPIADQSSAAVPVTSGTSVQVQVGTVPELRAGDKFRIPVLLSGSTPFGSAVIGLKFDPKAVAVRSVSFGDVFNGSANTAVTPFVNQDGKMYVSLSPNGSEVFNALGNVAYIEVEALQAGRPAIALDKDILSFLTRDGKSISIKVNE